MHFRKCVAPYFMWMSIHVQTQKRKDFARNRHRVGGCVLVFVCQSPRTVDASYGLDTTTLTATNTSSNWYTTGSLGWAIRQGEDANGPTQIVFDIPNTDPGYDATKGVWVIQRSGTSTILPKLSTDHGGTIIDATTQTVNRGGTNPYGPEILLDGEGVFYG